jgi:hypothetical protein
MASRQGRDTGMSTGDSLIGARIREQQVEAATRRLFAGWVADSLAEQRRREGGEKIAGPQPSPNLTSSNLLAPEETGRQNLPYPAPVTADRTGCG